MIKVKYLKNGDISEESIHKLILNYIGSHPYLFQFKNYILHFPSEGKRTPSYGLLMKSLGMRKGVADLFIAVPKRGFGGAWIELKSAKGLLRPEQMEFLANMKEQNFYTCACWSIDEAIETITWYFEI